MHLFWLVHCNIVTPEPPSRSYRKTRPKASLESIRRSKLLNCDSVLPVFAAHEGSSSKSSTSREAAVAALKDFRAKATIFEALGNT